LQHRIGRGGTPIIIFVPILVPIASRAHLPATAVTHTYRAHPWALFALFALRRGTRARATGQVGAEAEYVVSHQPDSSTFRFERGRELMTRRADTDMTCSRGEAGTVGYAAMACCFLQDLFLSAIIRSAISPYRNSLTFDAWPGSEWQSRNLRLTPGRPPNVVRPLGRERSLQPSSSLHFVRRCAGYALLHSCSQRLAALLMILVMGYFIKLVFYAVNIPRSGLAIATMLWPPMPLILK
jgi:hypothetical protein